MCDVIITHIIIIVALGSSVEQNTVDCLTVIDFKLNPYFNNLVKNINVRKLTVERHSGSIVPP